MEKEGISMNEEKKNLSKDEMTEEELNKVAGGLWTAKDTAKFEDLREKYEKTLVFAMNNLNKAKKSGDPVVIQKAQEIYDKCFNLGAPIREMIILFKTEWEDTPESCYPKAEAIWASLDYQYYVNTFDNIRSALGY